MDEEALSGGVANAGAVARAGDTVRRPAGPHTPAVHALLRHLRAVGFDAAPEPLGVDDGREVLAFVPGEVATLPYPAWVASDDLLASVAALHRRYHDAVRSFVPPPDARWQLGYGGLPPGCEGTLVGHNDLCIENVVVRQGRAAALLDFDYAHPVDPRFDIAVAVRHWVPLRDPADCEPVWAGADRVARFAAYGDAFALTRAGRAAVLDAVHGFLDLALARIRAHVDAGHPGFTALWAGGYEGANRRAQAWVAAHRALLLRG